MICDGKRAYRNRGEANATLARMKQRRRLSRGAGVLQSYLCACGSWHLGHYR